MHILNKYLITSINNVKALSKQKEIQINNPNCYLALLIYRLFPLVLCHCTVFIS